jgi:NADH-quinone oxidoreductase subunit C
MSDEVESADAPADAQSPEMYNTPLTSLFGQDVVHPTRDGYHDLAATLRADGFHMCIDITAVDFLGSPGRPLPDKIAAERFEVVAQFIDHAARRRLRVRVQIPEGDPSVATITDLFPGAEALEREAHDMFGISFDGHPDLTRILMPEDWVGYPLRKDYDVGRIPVQFKGAS